MDKLIRHLVRKCKTNNPFDIAGELNILVRFVNLGEGTRGLYFRKYRRRFIVIHEGLDEAWQRFVCAHELAHDRLHPGFSRFWIDDHTFFNAGKYESQANRFAVRLLTAGDSLGQGETVEELLQRNSVPVEMQKFYC